MKSSYPILSRLSAALPALAIAAILSSPWPAAVAAPVTSKQAAAAVTGWLSLDRTPLGETLGTSVLRVDTFSDKAGNSLYYVVYLEPSGFGIPGDSGSPDGKHPPRLDGVGNGRTRDSIGSIHCERRSIVTPKGDLPGLDGGRGVKQKCACGVAVPIRKLREMEREAIRRLRQIENGQCGQNRLISYIHRHS